MPDDRKPTQDDDKLRPDAIAARVDQLGGETDAERVAREEEQKLSQRKQERGKSGLEAAASRRLAKIGEGSVKRPSALTANAIPEAASLVARAANASDWIQKHSAAFAVLVAVAVLGVGGGLGWVYWQGKRDADASVLLARAMADEHGHVVTKDKDDDSDDETATKELYPTFKSVAERRDAALAKYRGIEAKYAGTGAAILARLNEASLLLDAGDVKGAIAGYEDVKGSALAQADGEVRGRALEGMGFADELLAKSDEAGSAKHLDDALAEFKALAAVSVDGFKELGKYHQARVLLAKGDKAGALELLKDVRTHVTDPQQEHAFSYLELTVDDRIREIDPTALPPTPPASSGGSGGPSGVDMNDPKIQKILRQLQMKSQQSGGPTAPVAPPGPGR